LKKEKAIRGSIDLLLKIPKLLAASNIKFWTSLFPPNIPNLSDMSVLYHFIMFQTIPNNIDLEHSF